MSRVIASEDSATIEVLEELIEMGEVAAEEEVQDGSGKGEQDGSTRLHTAVRKGNIERALQLLDEGVSATEENSQGLTPLDTAAVSAAATGQIGCFKKVFTRATEIEKTTHGSDVANKWNEAVRGILETDDCEVQLEQIQEMSSVQLYCATVTDPDCPQKPKVSLRKLLSSAYNKGQTIEPAFLEAFFDRCLFGGKLIVTDMLEADADGHLPKDYSRGKGISLLHYLTSKPALFFKLAKHPTLRSFVEFQWKKNGGRKFWLRLLYYLFQMVVLTFALAIAARPDLSDDQINLYPEPIDYFRGICEGLLIIMMVAKVFDEIVEFAFTPFRTYYKDWMNYLQWCSAILTLMIIPFRAVNHPGQWIVAALAYVFHGLKATEYTSLFRLTGTYVHTLGVIISRDISKFTAIFLAFLIVFSGSFYLSLRYDDSVISFDVNGTLVSGRGINSDLRSLDGEGRLLHEVYFTGLRSLVESGSVLSYYGSDGGFRALSVILYLAFLFMVVIVLLNVLIAQVSDTYTKVLATAPEVFLSHQAWYMVRMEEQKYAACLPYSFIQALYHKCCLYLPVIRCCYMKYHRTFPSIMWVGDHAGANKWEKVVHEVSRSFSVYGFDDEEEEDSQSTVLKKIEDEGHRLEEKIEQTNSTLEEKMTTRVDELAEQLKDLKYLLEKIDKAMAGRQELADVEKVAI